MNQDTQASQMYIEEWGSGPTVVLVHGGGSGGAANFQQQKPLAGHWKLLLPDRPGHGRTPAHGREDFETDAPLIADLLGDGAHLVGHSYGGVVALLAAALRPEAVWSLTLIEPAAFAVARSNPIVDQFAESLIELWQNPPEPEVFMRQFFELNGIPTQLPSPLPPPLVAAARGMLSIRGPWEANIPVEEIRNATFPKLVISGGHKQAFEIICNTLATEIGAERAVIPGKGHSVQDTGAPFNHQLEAFLKGAQQRIHQNKHQIM